MPIKNIGGLIPVSRVVYGLDIFVLLSPQVVPTLAIVVVEDVEDQRRPGEDLVVLPWAGETGVVTGTLEGLR